MPFKKMSMSKPMSDIVAAFFQKIDRLETGEQCAEAAAIVAAMMASYGTEGTGTSPFHALTEIFIKAWKTLEAQGGHEASAVDQKRLFLTFMDTVKPDDIKVVAWLGVLEQFLNDNKSKKEDMIGMMKFMMSMRMNENEPSLMELISAVS